MLLFCLIFISQLLFSSGSLTQAIRNFAKSLENWLKGAMHGVPDEMVKTKVSVDFCYLLNEHEIFFKYVIIKVYTKN